MGYSPLGSKESDTAEQLQSSLTFKEKLKEILHLKAYRCTDSTSNGNQVIIKDSRNVDFLTVLIDSKSK